MNNTPLPDDFTESGTSGEASGHPGYMDMFTNTCNDNDRFKEDAARYSAAGTWDDIRIYNVLPLPFDMNTGIKLQDGI